MRTIDLSDEEVLALVVYHCSEMIKYTNPGDSFALYTVDKLVEKSHRVRLLVALLQDRHLGPEK